MFFYREKNYLKLLFIVFINLFLTISTLITVKADTVVYPKGIGSVIVAYQDKDTTETLVDSDVLIDSKKVGTSYQAVPKDIDGYKYVGLSEYSDKQKGKVEQGVLVVIFHYQKAVTETFEFIASNTKKELPLTVTRLLPTRKTKYLNGETAKAPKLTTTEIITSTGTWTFEGWEKETIKVNNSNIKFVGKWNWKENKNTITEEKIVSQTKENATQTEKNESQSKVTTIQNKEGESLIDKSIGEEIIIEEVVEEKAEEVVKQESKSGIIKEENNQSIDVEIINVDEVSSGKDKEQGENSENNEGENTLEDNNAKEKTTKEKEYISFENQEEVEEVVRKIILERSIATKDISTVEIEIYPDKTIETITRVNRVTNEVPVDKTITLTNKEEIIEKDVNTEDNKNETIGCSIDSDCGPQDKTEQERVEETEYLMKTNIEETETTSQENEVKDEENKVESKEENSEETKEDTNKEDKEESAIPSEEEKEEKKEDNVNVDVTSNDSLTKIVNPQHLVDENEIKEDKRKDESNEEIESRDIKKEYKLTIKYVDTNEKPQDVSAYDLELRVLNGEITEEILKLYNENESLLNNNGFYIENEGIELKNINEDTKLIIPINHKTTATVDEIKEPNLEDYSRTVIYTFSDNIEKTYEVTQYPEIEKTNNVLIKDEATGEITKIDGNVILSYKEMKLPEIEGYKLDNYIIESSIYNQEDVNNNIVIKVEYQKDKNEKNEVNVDNSKNVEEEKEVIQKREIVNTGNDNNMFIYFIVFIVNCILCKIFIKKVEKMA